MRKYPVHTGPKQPKKHRDEAQCMKINRETKMADKKKGNQDDMVGV